MLSYNNKNDISEMMNYHRTRDMINLLKYFPDLSPIMDLTIVKDIDDYMNNKEYCDSFMASRNDTLITKPSMASVETSGTTDGLLEIFKKVKGLDSDGVLVLFNLSHEASKRYERYAGISIGVSVGVCVYIDAVGRGYDGREVSKGLDCHERYFIPWFDVRKCNLSNFKNYRTYLVNEDDYKISRKKRIEFLVSVGMNEDEVSKSIPESYSEIPDFIWLDIIKNFMRKLDDMEDEFEVIGITEFALSGHTEGKHFLPWQMFDKSRYGA